jgi:hypothetical protein
MRLPVWSKSSQTKARREIGGLFVFLLGDLVRYQIAELCRIVFSPSGWALRRSVTSASSMSNIGPEKSLIFRITHVANVPWILANGLHCSSSNRSDSNYVQIGNPELIGRRATRAVPIAPGGTLSDYIPFYFTPYSPMLYNIKTGYNGIAKRSMAEIAILVASLRLLREKDVPFVFTDRHAYLQAAQFYNDLERLDQIDWAGLQSRDFRRNPEDPGKVERYQAEALIHRHLPTANIVAIIHNTEEERRKTEQHCGTLNLSMQILYAPRLYL